MTAEFEAIERYFSFSPASVQGVALGVGDDCALLDVPDGMQLATSVDTVVSGVHFPPEASPGQVVRRLVAVNVSDLAACGAEPRWATLAMTLPVADADWLESFSQGLRAACDQYQLALVGGDTTRGPLTLTLQVFGVVPKGMALKRDGACPGDLVFVSGPLGDGAAGLHVATGQLPIEGEQRDYLLRRFYQPVAQLELAAELRGVASACIDISDGLLADLGHICQRSKVGATLDWSRVPLSRAVQDHYSTVQQKQLALTGGDDYQLCFTVAPKNIGTAEQRWQEKGLRCYVIGVIDAQAGVRCLDQGEAVSFPSAGFDHFKEGCGS